MSSIIETENPAAIQLKITHWIEMAMTILKSTKNTPEEFGVIATNGTIEVVYPNGYSMDKGDYLTPAGGEVTYEERNLDVSENTTALDVYEFLEECVVDARYYQRQLAI
jgi:hypothetical protein